MNNTKQSSIDTLCQKLAMKLGGLAITFYIDHAEEIAEAKSMHKQEIEKLEQEIKFLKTYIKMYETK